MLSYQVLSYQIRIPKEQDAEAFVTFMREEYLPAIYKGQRRLGRVTALLLLRRQNEFAGDDMYSEFLWHESWETLDSPHPFLGVDEEVTRKFESFKADVQYIGSYEEVAAWSGYNAA